MQLRTPYRTTELRPEVAKQLAEYRKQRGFSPVDYLTAKTNLINAYFTKHKLTAAVVAVSGGVDSAVTLGLVVAASRIPGSPIKKIIPVTLPVFTTSGVTGQIEATALAEEVCQNYGLSPVTIDLSDSFTTLRTAIESSVQLAGKSWAAGQLVPYLRTPTLYYLTSLLAESGLPAVVCGTTNRDEGAYLGFFGKASDGMVDVQLIADLHKSEVYALGTLLKIPEKIIKRTPTGDMFDAAPDEQVFGAPYDFVELYLHFLTLSPSKKETFTNTLSTEAREQFTLWQTNLERLHQYNGHKYLVGSPAVHLNVYESGVPGGWNEPKTETTNAFDRKKFVNEQSLPLEILNTFSSPQGAPVSITNINHPNGSVFTIENLLNDDEKKSLQQFMLPQVWQPVGVHGTYQNFDSSRDEIGSYRLSWYSPELADILWQRLASLVPMLKTFTPENHPEGGGHEVWRAVGVNELFRGIKYESGGWLLPHYDAPFAYNDHRQTLLSFVIYLSDTADETSGVTRFLNDPSTTGSTTKNPYADAPCPPKNEDIIFKILPAAGNALIFDHRLFHDGERVTGTSPKLIIRTDIIYERVSSLYV